jgi:hypothetical protein
MGMAILVSCNHAKTAVVVYQHLQRPHLVIVARKVVRSSFVSARVVSLGCVAQNTR